MKDYTRGNEIGVYMKGRGSCLCQLREERALTERWSFRLASSVNAGTSLNVVAEKTELGNKNKLD